MLPTLLLLLALPASRIHGETGALSPVDEFVGELQAYSEKLAALPPPPAACQAAYAKVEAEIPLSMGVFFGYIDTGRINYVADGDFKRALIRQLTKGCFGQLRACGFSASFEIPGASNETRLLKAQGNRNITISIYDSTVDSDYSSSVSLRSVEQEAKSRLVEEEYLSALKHDAVVLYAGHTRRFIGTGFFPPLAFSKISASVLLRRPFYSRVYDSLRRSASPAVLGLFACHTREYYAGFIHALAPGIALIVSPDASSHENNLLGVFGAINMALARPCYGEAVAGINAGDAPVFRIYGLFGQSPHPRYTRYLDGRLVVIGLIIIPLLTLFVSKWAPSTVAAWPTGNRPGAWGGTALLVLLMIPCAYVVRESTDQSSAFPLLLALLGLLSLAVAVGKGRISFRQFVATAKQTAPAVLVFLLLYACSNLSREGSFDNALSALRQAVTFLAVFVLLWPFVYFSEEVLFAPFVGDEAPGFIPSCVHTLAFYLALWLSLCALAPVYKPKLWPMMALALYVRTSSFLLHRRKPQLMIPAISLAMTLALFITEGIHALMYN